MAEVFTYFGIAVVAVVALVAIMVTYFSRKAQQ